MTATRGFSTQQEASSSGYPDGTNSASSGGAPNALSISAGPYYPRSSYYNCEPRKKSGMLVHQLFFFPFKRVVCVRVFLFYLVAFFCY